MGAYCTKTICNIQRGDSKYSQMVNRKQNINLDKKKLSIINENIEERIEEKMEERMEKKTEEKKMEEKKTEEKKTEEKKMEEKMKDKMEERIEKKLEEKQTEENKTEEKKTEKKMKDKIEERIEKKLEEKKYKYQLQDPDLAKTTNSSQTTSQPSNPFNLSNSVENTILTTDLSLMEAKMNIPIPSIHETQHVMENLCSCAVEKNNGESSVDEQLDKVPKLSASKMKTEPSELWEINTDTIYLSKSEIELMKAEIERLKTEEKLASRNKMASRNKKISHWNILDII